VEPPHLHFYNYLPRYLTVVTDMLSYPQHRSQLVERCELNPVDDTGIEKESR